MEKVKNGEAEIEFHSTYESYKEAIFGDDSIKQPQTNTVAQRKKARAKKGDDTGGEEGEEWQEIIGLFLKAYFALIWKAMLLAFYYHEQSKQAHRPRSLLYCLYCMHGRVLRYYPTTDKYKHIFLKQIHLSIYMTNI